MGFLHFVLDPENISQNNFVNIMVKGYQDRLVKNLSDIFVGTGSLWEIRGGKMTINF